MDSRARHLVAVGKKLFAAKAQYDSLCQEIAENFYPLRADFTTSFTLGEDFSTDLMESFPVQARETLGNTIGALLRQGDWFQAKTGFEEIDEDPSAARWLEYATKRHKRLIYDRHANLVRACNEVDHDWVAFGGGVMSVGESTDRSRFLFRAWHPRDCAWIENANCAVDRLHRKMKMTARAIMANPRWAKNAHQDIRNAAEKSPTDEFEIQHIVLPVDELYGDDKARRRRFAAQDMPFVSLYVDCAHDIVLGEGPLPVFPYVTPRWRTISTFAYGFSPAAITALPDGRMIQSMARVLLEQGEKAVDPPTVAKGDIFRDAVNLYAGGMTYVDMEDSDDIRKIFQTVDTGGNIGLGLEMKQDVRMLIAESFLLNKITLPPQQKTAFETQARLDEYRRAILPFTGPIESDYHLPLLDISFQMAVRNKQFDFAEMPENLEGKDITFSFEGPLNTAEGRKNVQAFMESVQIIAAGAQFDNTVPAKWNLGKMTEDAVKGTGAPVDWENNEETQQSEEDQTRTIDGLAKAAQMLSGGAQVGGQVADAALKLQQAGLA